MSLVEDVATYLESVGMDVPVYRGRVPDSPDAVLAVLDYAGLAPQIVHDEVLPAYERPNFQVVARGERDDYDAAHDAAYAAWRALFVHGAVINGTTYHSIEPLASPFRLDVDANDRVIFAANFTTRRKVTDG